MASHVIVVFVLIVRIDHVVSLVLRIILLRLLVIMLLYDHLLLPKQSMHVVHDLGLVRYSLVCVGLPCGIDLLIHGSRLCDIGSARLTYESGHDCLSRRLQHLLDLLKTCGLSLHLLKKLLQQLGIHCFYLLQNG